MTNGRPDRHCFTFLQFGLEFGADFRVQLLHGFFQLVGALQRLRLFRRQAAAGLWKAAWPPSTISAVSTAMPAAAPSRRHSRGVTGDDCVAIGRTMPAAGVGT
jgi:hypothetical protein